MAVEQICRDCKFWEEVKVLRNRGMCRRFPQPTDTAASHWCGEYISKAKHDGLRELAEEVAIAKEPKKDKKKDNVETV